MAKGAGQAERATTAQKLADALAPKLAKLRIEAPNAPIGTVIERDGVVVGPGALWTFVLVDPGKHEVVASAPGHAADSDSVRSVCVDNKVTAPRKALLSIT